eukprot:478-Rhodomonas_salina.1
MTYNGGAEPVRHWCAAYSGRVHCWVHAPLPSYAPPTHMILRSSDAMSEYGHSAMFGYRYRVSTGHSVRSSAHRRDTHAASGERGVVPSCRTLHNNARY